MADIKEQWQSYLGYLVEWANTHQDSGNMGMNPICFNEYLDNEYQEDSDRGIFGLVYWSNDDIINTLEVNDIEPTDSNMEILIDALDEEQIKEYMIESGWEYIYGIIDGLIEDGAFDQTD